MLNETKAELIVQVYKDCTTEEEREETIQDFAKFYKTSTMEVRQILQQAKVYGTTEGKTQKEQYANALYAVTTIPPKEWMKLNFKSQVKLMKIFREGK